MSIVERLQRDALNQQIPISSLLRQVKLIAAKLKLGKIEDWVENELNGYGDNSIPDYRIIKGSPKAHNPFHGWIPILLDDPEMMEQISTRDIGQKVSELEDLVTSSDNATLQIPFPPHFIAAMNQNTRVPLAQMSLLTGRSAIIGILDAVRNKILDWSLELEKTGILGSDVSFSAEEQRLAKQPNVTMNIGSIANFVGNISAGDIKNSDVTGKIEIDDVQKLIEQLNRYKDELTSAGVNQKKLDEILKRLEDATTNDKSNQSTLRDLLGELRDVVVGASGNLVASGVVALINQILGTGVPTP